MLIKITPIGLMPRDHTKLNVAGLPLVAVLSATVLFQISALLTAIHIREWVWAALMGACGGYTTFVLYLVLVQRNWKRYGYPQWVRQYRGWP